MTSGAVPSVPVSAVPAPSITQPLVDVREDDEWQAGHAPGALHIPMADIPARISEVLDRADGADVTAYVLCHVGGRSARVVQYLRHAGIDAVNVDGGMVAWQQAGLPVVDDGGRPATVV